MKLTNEDHDRNAAAAQQWRHITYIRSRGVFKCQKDGWTICTNRSLDAAIKAATAKLETTREELRLEDEAAASNEVNEVAPVGQASEAEAAAAQAPLDAPSNPFFQALLKFRFLWRVYGGLLPGDLQDAIARRAGRGV